MSNIRFMSRTYRSAKVRTARELEAEKIFERRADLANEREELRKKEEKEREQTIPVLSALEGEDFARISAPNKKNTD